jgi:hypothetical protein
MVKLCFLNQAFGFPRIEKYFLVLVVFPCKLIEFRHVEPLRYLVSGTVLEQDCQEDIVAKHLSPTLCLVRTPFGVGRKLEGAVRSYGMLLNVNSRMQDSRKNLPTPERVAPGTWQF